MTNPATAETATGGGRRPNLVIAGVAKAGTTSLFSYLHQHPDIGTSDIKELRYFTPLRYGQPLPPLEEYTRHFRSCLHTRYALEATPGYFYGGRTLARAMKETCPDMHVIINLRAPAERCWSWFNFVKSRVRIPRETTFGAYLDTCEDLHRAGVDHLPENQPFWGLGAGCYADWLGDWIAEFEDRLHIVFFDDLQADPAGVITSLCSWLELDAAPVEDFDFAVENKTVPYRSRRLQRAAVTVNRHSETFFRRHPAVKRRLRSGYYALNRDDSASQMLPVDRRRLDAFYRPYDERLAAQLATLDLRRPERWLSDAASA